MTRNGVKNLALLTVVFVSTVVFQAYGASSTDAVQAAKMAGNSDDYIAALVSVRYFKNVSVDDVVTMRAIWDSDIHDFKSSELSRSLLAEQLYRFDPGNKPEYLRYIVERTESENEEVRAESLYSLGFLHVNEMQPTLLKAVETGTAKEAKNAGYGLIMFERPEVYTQLCTALSVRGTEDEVATRVTDYLWSHAKWRC